MKIISRFIQHIQRRIRDYFGFSKVEANGTIILLIFLSLILMVPSTYRRLSTTPHQTATDTLYLDSLLALLPAPEVPNQEFEAQKYTQPTSQIEYFTFDPNSISQEKLTLLGLPTWLAERIVKYRNAGGRFRIKSDLAKIYGMSDRQFRLLEPYIALPEKILTTEVPTPLEEEETNSRESIPYQPKHTPLEPFDANEADTAQWKRVYGIGSGYAARIIKFRDALGGYVRKDQLSEVYGLPEEVFERLDSLVYIHEEFTPQQIAINHVDAETLAKHPYIRSRQARAIIAYRDQHGEITKDNFDQLQVLPEEVKQKLLPYLSFSSDEP